MFLRRKSYVLIIILFVFCLLSVPIVVNSLMSFNFTKVYGDTNAWIGFLGGYIGAVISGLITFLGVLLTLEFTKSETRKDKLPLQIDNLEECLDIIEGNLTTLNQLNQIDVQETINKQAHFRKTIFYTVGSEYNLLKKNDINIDDYTLLIEKQLRKHLIKVNAEAYISYRRFARNLEQNYLLHIEPITERLSTFQALVMEEYLALNPGTIINTSLANLKLSPNLLANRNKIIGDLYYKEYNYIASLIDAFSLIQIDLLDILESLRLKLDY
jgi:hypothetical protein